MSIKTVEDKGQSAYYHLNQLLEEKFGALRTEIDERTLSGEDRQEMKRIQAEVNAALAELKALKINAAAPRSAEDMEAKSRRETQESKAAFNKALRFGVGSLKEEERKYVKLDIESGINTEYKAMYEADATTGGFLSTPEYVNQLIEFITLVSPMPSLVEIRTTSKPWVMTPRKTQTASAVRVAEQATRTETQNPKFGLVQNFPYESYAFSLVSRTDMDDSELDLGAFLMKEFATQFAKLQGYEYINGKGQNAGEAQGFLTDSTINNGGNGTVTTTASGLLDYPSLVKLKQSLKPGYLPTSTWIWTNETLGAIQMLTDSQNRPLWVPFGGTLPDTIFGRPYVVMPDMPQMAANGGSAGALAIAFGSFKDAYQGVIRKQVSMQALYERYADQNAIGYFGYFRFGGVVKLSEAVKTLRVHV